MAKRSTKGKPLNFKQPRIPQDFGRKLPKDILKLIPIELLTAYSAKNKTLKAWWDVTHIAARSITNKIVAKVRVGAAGRGKNVNNAAIQEWADLLYLHVYFMVGTGANWTIAEPTVLTVAEGMGDIAATLTGSGAECKKLQLQWAFAASKVHADCQSSGGSGGGDWCTFDWF
jgi:hypothetical protein